MSRSKHPPSTASLAALLAVHSHLRVPAPGARARGAVAAGAGRRGAPGRGRLWLAAAAGLPYVVVSACTREDRAPRD